VVPPLELADLAGFGPYFAVDTHHPRSPLAAPWQPLSTLTSSPQDLRDRIAAVRAALAAAAGQPPGAVEFRVAASVTQLGTAARLISPPLGAAVISGAVLRMDSTARWQPVLGGPFPLSLPVAKTTRPPAQGDGGEDDALAEELARHVVNGPIRALTEMTIAMSVPPTVLWGNIASAVNGATHMIAAARPSLTARAQAISTALLQHPPLAGTWDGAPAARFLRRNCCLIYRVGPRHRAAICGDCVLQHPQPT
jgi:hypothetical protein